MTKPGRFSGKGALVKRKKGRRELLRFRRGYRRSCKEKRKKFEEKHPVGEGNYEKVACPSGDRLRVRFKGKRRLFEKGNGLEWFPLQDKKRPTGGKVIVQRIQGQELT